MIEAIEYLRIQLVGRARTERGASAVEYGLLVTLIAIAIIAGAFLLGGKLNTLFKNTSSSIA